MLSVYDMIKPMLDNRYCSYIDTNEGFRETYKTICQTIEYDRYIEMDNSLEWLLSNYMKLSYRRYKKKCESMMLSFLIYNDVRRLYQEKIKMFEPNILVINGI